jgi:uncharacterized membrane protein YqaE (UPF0057 family)
MAQCLQCLGKATGPAAPPLCVAQLGPGGALAVSILVALFIPPLAHWLSRPGDWKSPSFLGVTFTYVLGWFFGALFINGFNPLPFDGGFGFFSLIAFLSVIWTIVIAVYSFRGDSYNHDNLASDLSDGAAVP